MTNKMPCVINAFASRSRAVAAGHLRRRHAGVEHAAHRDGAHLAAGARRHSAARAQLVVQRVDAPREARRRRLERRIVAVERAGCAVDDQFRAAAILSDSVQAMDGPEAVGLIATTSMR